MRVLLLAIGLSACSARKDAWQGGPGEGLDQGRYGSVPVAAARGPAPELDYVVDVEATVRSGSLSAEALEAVAAAHRSQLAYCYRRAKLGTPELGAHALTLGVGLRRGTPVAVDVLASSFPDTDPSVPACVRTGAAHWAWPSPRSDAAAEIVLRLGPA